MRGGEAGAVGVRQLIIFAEDVAFDLNDALLAQAGDVNAGKAAAEIDRVARRGVRMIMAMIMIETMVMSMVVVMMVMVAISMRMRVGMAGAITVMVMMRMAVRLGLCAGLDGGWLIAAAADRTHQATSNSLIRISSPWVTCS
jgi:hypothetical protein